MGNRTRVNASQRVTLRELDFCHRDSCVCMSMESQKYPENRQVYGVELASEGVVFIAAGVGSAQKVLLDTGRRKQDETIGWSH
ncbi:hypothetical protein BaRGS_00032803 [Batillaria attramentaria]|uniref:Uncharacterized protein n=1 Tax=Batillaria attramentaria TaxID=370345 RepID=A0ABD0JM38_9CAEN